MANITIGGLPDVSPSQSGDLIEIERAGAGGRINLGAELASGTVLNITDDGGGVHVLTAAERYRIGNDLRCNAALTLRIPATAIAGTRYGPYYIGSVAIEVDIDPAATGGSIAPIEVGTNGLAQNQGPVFIRVISNAVGTAPTCIVEGAVLGTGLLLTGNLDSSGYATKTATVVSTHRVLTIATNANILASDNGRYVVVADIGTVLIPTVPTLCPNTGDAFSCRVVATASGSTILRRTGTGDVTLTQNQSAMILAYQGGACRIIGPTATPIIS
jgi:hypothetical protein